MEKHPTSCVGFVCSIDNPIGANGAASNSMGRHRSPWGAIGLHLKFYTDDEGCCVDRCQPKPQYQGHTGHLHGGAISTSLDVPTQIPVHPDPLPV